MEEGREGGEGNTSSSCSVDSTLGLETFETLDREEGGTFIQSTCGEHETNLPDEIFLPDEDRWVKLAVCLLCWLHAHHL